MENQKIKLVVIDEHTLGYLRPGSTDAGILHTSILRGSYLNGHNTVETTGRQVRLATKQDFEDYRVSFKGYGNDDDYEYQKD